MNILTIPLNTPTIPSSTHLSERATILKPVSGNTALALDPCDGKETLVKARDTFDYIDPELKIHGTDEKGKATAEMLVAVYELMNGVDFTEMFTSLHHDVHTLTLTQSQIINFVKKYRGWLRNDGQATFFLFTVGNRLLVAEVFRYTDGQIFVYLGWFDLGFIWLSDSGHQVVVPLLRSS